MTTESSDHPNAYKELDIQNLKIYTKYIASFVEAKIASFVDSKGKSTPVQKATLYRYRYIGGPRSIALFPTNVRYCIVFSTIGLDEIIPKIPPHADCTVLNGSNAIIVPIDDFIKVNYSFFSDVYNLKGHLDIVDTSKDKFFSENFKKMLREWQILAIDAGTNEFADTCPILNLDFPNIVLYERSKNKPENLESLLIEAVPEVARVYKIFKKTRKNTIEEKEIKKGLKLYFNSQKSSFNLVTEKILNNDFIYSLTNTNHDRRDFCGRLLSKIAEAHGYSQAGSQSLFKRMLKIEAANKKSVLT
jgi:hypothetical protein